MKLYYSKAACSLVVRIIINEIGVPCTYESVDLKTKKTETGADFLTINPKGSVPTIVTDSNKILTENAVILQFLADSNNATNLLPPVNDFDRYRVLEWLNFTATELHKGFSPLFNPEIPKEVKEHIFIKNLIKKFTFLNQHLQHNKYLMGDNFTLPDAYVYVILRWATAFKIDFSNFSNLSHLMRYFEELQARKSIQKSIEEEGLS